MNAGLSPVSWNCLVGPLPVGIGLEVGDRLDLRVGLEGAFGVGQPGRPLGRPPGLGHPELADDDRLAGAAPPTAGTGPSAAPIGCELSRRRRRRRRSSRPGRRPGRRPARRRRWKPSAVGHQTQETLSAPLLRGRSPGRTSRPRCSRRPTTSWPAGWAGPSPSASAAAPAARMSRIASRLLADQVVVARRPRWTGCRRSPSSPSGSRPGPGTPGRRRCRPVCSNRRYVLTMLSRRPRLVSRPSTAASRPTWVSSSGLIHAPT